MKLSLISINRKTVFSWFVFIILVEFVIGFFFYSIHIDNFSLAYHLISPQVGGLITTASVLVSLYVVKPKSANLRFAVIMFAVIAGALLAGVFETPVREVYFMNLIFSILIGSMIFGFAFYWENMTITESNLEEAKINRLQLEKKMTEARLRTLQAQVEPHFLFNTLSNILNLFDTDIEKGASMQKDLILYLKSSLFKIRMDATTLGEEITLVSAYLNIFKVRMGNRLKYFARIPEELQQIPFPPMLIQPLVENAIKHGVEPKIEGGEIAITVERIGRNLKITVSDTGLGMQPDSGQSTGLVNIRERLHLLYGAQGRLMLTDNRPCGLNAIIEVPYDAA